MMKKFHVKFSEKNLTGNAGLVHLGKFAEKLGLGKALDRKITIQRGDTAKYQVPDTVIMLAMGVLAGVRHMSHMAVLASDSALRALFNWKHFPDHSTFGRIFRLFTPRHCQELSEVESELRKKVWTKKWFGRVTLDMDSTVKGVYGSQEGAAKGYNAKKKGQKSYHPLLCFVAETRECLNSWFRSGDAYSANGSAEFMKECLAKLPKRVWKVAVRGDSAFFGGELLALLEEKGCEYLIKVKMRGLHDLLEKQTWRKIKNRPGWESAKFVRKCGGWERERVFLAVRRLADVEYDGGELFNMPVCKYEYFCYVTNMRLTPWNAHKYYGKRAASENWIEWCKNQPASGSILTQDFWANSAIFQTCILAYNLMVWMMWLNAEKGFREEPETIRFWLIHVPAKLLHRSRQWTLRLPDQYPYKRQWRELENAMAALNFY